MNITSKDLTALRCIHEGTHCLLYQQETSDYGAPVTLKVLKEAYPTQGHIVRFGNEYELTKDLTFPGIRKAFETLVIDHKPVMEAWSPQSVKKNQLLLCNNLTCDR